MPVKYRHILDFLEDISNDKFYSELIDILIKTLNKLCFDECQIDRIQCTLTPLCSRRFLLKLRIKNGLLLEDLPKFCYSVHKNEIFRDFRGKTVVFKPFDAYLYLIDFLDVFYHGDYRKLNQFISLKKWDDTLKIFEDRINLAAEDFLYYLTENQEYIIIKYGERLHIIFTSEKYAICNAKREAISNLEIMYGICNIWQKIYFPEASVKIFSSEFVEISTSIPNDVISKVKSTNEEIEDSDLDKYFWEDFSNDIDTLAHLCKEIHLEINRNTDLEIKLYLSTETNNYIDKKNRLPLRFRDLRTLLEIVSRIYNDYYIIWID